MRAASSDRVSGPTHGGGLVRELARRRERQNDMEKLLSVGARSALAFLFAFVASCGTDDRPINSQSSGQPPVRPESGGSWGPLTVVDGDGSGDLALMVGNIVISGDCVLLDERGEWVLLVWPEGRTVWDQETGAVRYTGRDGAVATLRHGDAVSFGGGGSSRLEGGLSADDFLTSIEWVAEPQLDCVADTRWFVGDLVDTPAPVEDDTTDTEPASAEDARATGEVLPDWPPTEPGAAASCVYRYPDELAERPIAFDGTIVSIHRGDYIEEAAATPVDLDLQVNKVFRGDLGDTVTMHTFDFSAPGSAGAWDPTGIRILAAASESLDVIFCGFTRSYTVGDAELWEATFTD